MVLGSSGWTMSSVSETRADSLTVLLIRLEDMTALTVTMLL